jgi:hypothetical protein
MQSRAEQLKAVTRLLRLWHLSVSKTVRISICFRWNSQIYRLVWITESRDGVYLGLLGGQEEFHVSYHQDGTRHSKIGSEYHNRFSDAPIAAFTGFKLLDHVSLSMSPEWFTAATAYAGDEKTETLFVLDESLFRNRDTCMVDVWLCDRPSERSLLEAIGRTVSGEASFHIASETLLALDNFPNHKLGVTLRMAKIRQIDA